MSKRTMTLFKKVLFGTSSFLIFTVFVGCSSSPSDQQTEEEVVIQKPDSISTPVEDRLTMLNKQVQSSPTISSYLARADYYLSSNNIQSAFEDVSAARQIDSTNADVWYTGAKIFRKNLQIPLSLEYAKRAEANGMQSEDLFLLMSEEQLILMQYQDAISYANKALKVNTASEKAYYYKGLVYEESRDFKRAVSSYQTALEQKPTFSDAYNNLIKLYTAQDDFVMASQYVESGLRFIPNDPFLWYNYGVLLEEQNLVDSAVVTFSKSAELDETFDLARYKLGTLYESKSDYENAEKMYREVLKLNPAFELGYQQYGNMLLSQDNVEGAKEILRKGLIQFPDSEKLQQLYNKTK